MTEWERCLPWVESALEYAHGTHAIEDIGDGIRLGRFQFWPGKSSAAVTEVIVYPRLKAVNFFLIGGDLDELLAEIEPKVCAWAAAIGCSRVIGAGRKGFERVLRPLGYEPRWSYLAKELKP